MTQPRLPGAMLPRTPPTGAPPLPPGGGYYAQPVRQKTNGFAIAALVLGIIWLNGLGSILALVFGYKAKRQIDESNGAQGGRGMAIAGIVLGWIGIAGLLLLFTMVFVFAVGGSTDKAQTQACDAEKAAVEASVEAFRASTGTYPTSVEDLVGTFLRSTPEWYTVSGSTVTGSGPCT